MKILIDNVEVITIRVAAQRANVSTQYFYRVLNDESSGLVTKTDGKYKYVTLDSFNRWMELRNESN